MPNFGLLPDPNDPRTIWMRLALAGGQPLPGAEPEPSGRMGNTTAGPGAATNPLAALAGLFGGSRTGSGSRSGSGGGRSGPNSSTSGRTDENGYTPAEVLASQQRLAEYFQQRPITPQYQGWGGVALPAAANFGTGFASTYLPTRNEQRMQQNQDITRGASGRALAATTQEDYWNALNSGSPGQAEVAVAGRGQSLDPLHRAQVARAEAQARALEQQLDLDRQILGAAGFSGGGAGPGAVAGPGGGVNPLGLGATAQGFAQSQQEAEQQSGMTGGQFTPNPTPPPASPPSAPPPGRSNLIGAGAMDLARDRGDSLVTPAQAGPPGAPAGAPTAPPQPSISDILGMGARDTSQSLARPGANITFGQQGANAPPPTAGAPPPSATGPSLQDILGSRSPAERLAWAMAYRKDPVEASKMLMDWADPLRTRIANEAAARERGQAQGQATASLPTALHNGTAMLNNIQAVLSDPNLGNVTGWQGAEWWRDPQRLAGFLPNPIGMLPTWSSTHDTRERLEQIRGQTFVQAFQALRGGGAISDVEGRAASNAITRLQNLAQSDEGYRQALHDAHREVWALMNLARVKAGQPEVPYQPLAGTGQQQQNNRGGPSQPDAQGWVTMPDGTRIRAQPQQQGQ